MKLSILLAPALLAGAVALPAADDKAPVPVPQTPAPVMQSAAEADVHVYEQRLYGPGAGLVTPEKANEVVQAFRAAYEKLGSPRILFYVNRDLVDERSGLKLSGRKEKTETVVGERKSSFEADPNAPAPAAGTNPQTQVNVAIGGSAGNGTSDQRAGKGSSEARTTTVTGENTYSAGESTGATLADRLTVREVETLFGRPFRVAGAKLADQKVASSLIADKPIDHYTTATNESARKDREALSKVADLVVEVLVSSRAVNVAGVSGDRTVSVPDIQVTAIRLSDSAVLGQASSADVLGKDKYAARVVNQYDVREITEATALALMEDMTLANR